MDIFGLLQIISPHTLTTGVVVALPACTVHALPYAIFAVTAQPPCIVLCMILAVPGFLGWILPCFLYKRVEEREREAAAPLIEAKYDEIYELCRKGNKLLY